MDGDDLSRVAARLGLDVDRALGGGAFGAHLARSASGEEVVLKLLPDHPAFSRDRVADAVRCAEAVRAAGCPVPRFLQVGECYDRVYTIQEHVWGEVPDVLLLAHARQIVDLWQCQESAAGASDGAGETWARDVVTGLRTGTERVFIDHTVLRQATDPRVHRILDIAIGIGHEVEPSTFRHADVVHTDFHPSNVLVRGGRVVAVIDWEGARVGDSRLDIVGLATVPTEEEVEPPAAKLLRETAKATAPGPVFRALLALGALQRLTFAVRTRPDLLEWAIGTTSQLSRLD